MPYKDPEAQRAHQREWYARRRAEWIIAHGPCAICGSWEDLEVDHVDPTTKLSHRVWSWAKERREAELAKCQVLCGTHHQEKSTQYRRDNPTEHGDSRYTSSWDPCRCEVCTEAHRIKKQAWRDARRAAGLAYT